MGLSDFKRGLTEASDEKLTKEGRDKLIQDAAQAERKRVVQKVKQPETELGKRIKRLPDAPPDKSTESYTPRVVPGYGFKFRRSENTRALPNSPLARPL